jgi:ABC-type polysaccharide/polyol phosphate export permease
MAVAGYVLHVLCLVVFFGFESLMMSSVLHKFKDMQLLLVKVKQPCLVCSQVSYGPHAVLIVDACHG